MGKAKERRQKWRQSWLERRYEAAKAYDTRSFFLAVRVCKPIAIRQINDSAEFWEADVPEGSRPWLLLQRQRRP